MSSSQYRVPGQFDLEYLTIKTHKGISYDLKEIMEEFTIYEDMFAVGISGILIVADSRNLISNLPIVGGEEIRAKFKSERYEDGYTTVKFVIYKIQDRKAVDMRVQMYSLLLTTQEVMKSKDMTLSKAYSGPTEEVIESILGELGSTKSLETEGGETETISYLAPNIEPFECISYLSGGAYDASGTPWVFYEDMDGYHLKNLFSMIDGSIPSARQFKYGAVQASPSEAGGDAFDNITDYQFVDSLDRLHATKKGAFHNQLTSIDLVGKTHTNVEFDYETAFSGADIPAMDKFPIKADPNLKGNRKLHTTSVGARSLLLQKKRAILTMLTQNGIKAHIQGDSRLRVGSIVEFAIPSQEPHDNEYITENLTTGRFLLTSCKHVINKNEYFCTIELFKDSYGQSYDDIQGEV